MLVDLIRLAHSLRMLLPAACTESLQIVTIPGYCVRKAAELAAVTEVSEEAVQAMRRAMQLAPSKAGTSQGRARRRGK